MRTSTLQPNLNKACKQVSKALAKRATLPVCTHIKLETYQGMLRLTATDLDSAIMVDIGAMNEEDGAICVPGKLFAQIVAKAPKERIDLHTEDNTLIIRIGNSDMRLTGLDAEDFPPIPNVFEPYAEIMADELLEAINQTAFAVADEDTRPVLTCLCLTPKQDALKRGWLEFAAADGFRLAVRKAYAETHSDKQILVRGESLAKLAVSANGFLNKLTEPVKIMYHEVKGYENTVYDDAGNVLERTGEYVQSEQVAFIMGHTTMICQCVRGTFPNYHVLIPLNHNTRISFDREAMLSAVSSLKPVVADGSGIVRLELTPQFGELGRLSLCGRSEQIGDMRHELDCHYEDSGIDTPARRIAFNCAYLHDLLKCLKSDTVTLEITTQSSPGVFYPSFQSSIDDVYTHIIMPMFVQWPETPADSWHDLLDFSIEDFTDSEAWDFTELADVEPDGEETDDTLEDDAEQGDIGDSEPCSNCDPENVAHGYVELWDGRCPDCGRQVHACSDCANRLSCSKMGDHVLSEYGCDDWTFPPDQQMTQTQAEALITG